MAALTMGNRADGVLRDIRYAIRTLSRRPILVAGATISIGLCVAMNLTVHTLVRQMFFDTWITASRPETLDMIGPELSYPNFQDLRARNVLQDIAAWQTQPVTSTSEKGTTLLTAGVVSPNFFEVIDIHPRFGSSFMQPGDTASTDVTDRVVLDYAFWQQHYGADPRVIGTTIKLNGWPYVIVGILPEGFYTIVGPMASPNLYVPISPRVNRALEAREIEQFLGYGRRAEGMTFDHGAAAMRAAVEQLERDFPTANKDMARSLTYFPAEVARGRAELPTPVIVIAAALYVLVGLVLLVACINVAGLLAARAIERRGEMALRTALGARRGQLMQHLMAESLVLAALGCAAGAALALALPRLALLVSTSVNAVPVTLPAVYTLVLTLGVTICCGLAPAMVVNQLAPGAVLRWQAGGLAPRRWTAARTLVAAQVAVSCLLLTGAGVVLASFLRHSATNPGFDVTNTMLVQLRFPTTPVGAGAPQRTLEAYQRVLDPVPGIEQVTSVRNIPLGLLGTPLSRVKGGTMREGGIPIITNTVGPRYFETMRIKVEMGRDFNVDDQRPEASETPVIVNRTFAERFLRNGDPVAQPLEIETERGSGRFRQLRVIGVAADSKIQSLSEERRAVLYLPGPSNLLVVRAAGPATGSLRAVQQALTQWDPSASVTVTPMTDRLDAALGPFRTGTLVLGVLGGLALALAMVGLHGIISYTANRRKVEIGIRMALGATRRSIVRMVLKDAIVVIGIGSIVGGLLSAGLLVVLRPMLASGQDTLQAFMLLPTVLFLFAIGFIASLRPAWRAATHDPIGAIRYD